jgi:phosphatidylglycerol---prolipoprotein diacylglyceryl transferase
MWVHTLDPVIFGIGPFEVRWYGLVYVIGALLGFWALERARKSGKLDLTEKENSDFVLWMIGGVVIGARAVYVLVYNFSSFLSRPWAVFAVWEGGLSFHGGFVGIVLATLWFCKRKKISFWVIADILAAPLMFALALGRIANFINGELWGPVWDGAWCVVFPAAGDACRHPYQLYDGVKRFMIFGFLLWLGKREWKRGFIFWNFVLFEGIGRFILDFWKDEFTYWIFRPGQWMSLIMIVFVIYYLKKFHREDVKKLCGRAS